MTARAIPDADLVAYVREHGAVDTQAIRTQFGVCQSTAHRTLESLTARHLLERAGTRKAQYLTTVESNLYGVPKPLPKPLPKRSKKAGPWDALLRGAA